ncbi:hypothetical protein BJY24_006386 [Nocardia transvalensis]|uniref:Uncharacterized protein n=1 Tax=Nocardia transvalensis TaxID=37333 RepID=A0A7W9PKU7_9NOCA|nr:hypothetical protein [Nocardia transvalensis]
MLSRIRVTLGGFIRTQALVSLIGAFLSVPIAAVADG